MEKCGTGRLSGRVEVACRQAWVWPWDRRLQCPHQPPRSRATHSCAWTAFQASFVRCGSVSLRATTPQRRLACIDERTVSESSARRASSSRRRWRRRRRPKADPSPGGDCLHVARPSCCVADAAVPGSSWKAPPRQRWPSPCDAMHCLPQSDLACIEPCVDEGCAGGWARLPSLRRQPHSRRRFRWNRRSCLEMPNSKWIEIDARSDANRPGTYRHHRHHVPRSGGMPDDLDAGVAPRQNSAPCRSVSDRDASDW